MIVYAATEDDYETTVAVIGRTPESLREATRKFEQASDGWYRYVVGPIRTDPDGYQRFDVCGVSKYVRDESSGKRERRQVTYVISEYELAE